MYLSHKAKRTLENPKTTELTRLILDYADNHDSIAVESEILAALLIIKQSNREVFPHSARMLNNPLLTKTN